MQPRFSKLVAWQRADDLFMAVHRAAMSFPLHERFVLASQLRRAAFSVPANIVEGMTRKRPGDRSRFLNIAEASLAETAYCLHAAHRLGYLSDLQYDGLDTAVRQTAAPLVGLIRQVGVDSAPTT